ncbi:hypothetical protein BV25DRAFT_1469910 [Artomyces pyxidatus]|uniref:Uncharacterized protein n=1 Tax=Artomyces pyxidatus TaxID=48021 RepID=A0ACB8SKV0_9AGAM|nr:hypothetical protein BV25DRAFT_1469910 [Artomyces pyxidatus]
MRNTFQSRERRRGEGCSADGIHGAAEWQTRSGGNLLFATGTRGTASFSRARRISLSSASRKTAVPSRRVFARVRHRHSLSFINPPRTSAHPVVPCVKEISVSMPRLSPLRKVQLTASVSSNDEAATKHHRSQARFSTACGARYNAPPSMSHYWQLGARPAHNSLPGHRGHLAHSPVLPSVATFSSGRDLSHTTMISISGRCAGTDAAM